MTGPSPTYLLMEVVRQEGGDVEAALQLARTDIPPREAVALLRASHPEVFAFNARTATAQEVADRRDMIRAAHARKAQRAADARFLEQATKAWAARDAARGTR